MLLSLSVCFFFSWVQAFCLGIQLLHWHQPASTVLIKLLWLLFNSFSCKSGNGLQYIVIIQWARISDFRNPKGCSDFSSTVYMLNYMNLSKVRFIRWHHSNWHRPFFFFYHADISCFGNTSSLCALFVKSLNLCVLHILFQFGFRSETCRWIFCDLM